MIRTKEGYIRVWRICYNRNSNDWNDEPEWKVSPYAILDEREGKPTYKVVRMGWGYGKRQQRFIKKEQFYFSKEEAELALEIKLKGDS